MKLKKAETYLDMQLKPKLGTGVYTLPDVAAILKLPYYKVNRWINIFWDGKLGKEFQKKYTWNIGLNKAVNFYTLVELNIFYQLSKAGVPSREILEAHKQLSHDNNSPYPFAMKNVINSLRTDGRKVMLETSLYDIHSLVKGKQFYLTFIKDYLKNLDFENGELALRYWPIGKDHSIVCDPHHKFGMPVINGTNIQTQVIYDMIKSNEPIEFISSLYEISTSQVLDVVKFHQDAA